MNEIEYLSEEEIAKALTPCSNLYFVYFTETGDIDAITNEKRQSSKLNCIEFDYKRVEKFFKDENFINYKISLVDKDTPTIVKKTEDAGINTNFLNTISQAPSVDTTLVVEWNRVTKNWIFKIDQSYKHQLKELGLNAQLLFFITLKTNQNFLIRTITIDIKTLVDTEVVNVNWVTSAEEDIRKLSVTTRRFFDSYGLQVNE